MRAVAPKRADIGRQPCLDSPPRRAIVARGMFHMAASGQRLDTIRCMTQREAMSRQAVDLIRIRRLEPH